MSNKEGKHMCLYPKCPGFGSTVQFERCQNAPCQNLFHHLCQVQFEDEIKVDIGLTKRCYNCISAIANSKKLPPEGSTEKTSQTSQKTTTGASGQTGFKKCSVVLGPELYFYDTLDVVKEIVGDISTLPNKYGRIVAVPNRKKLVNYYEILYDRSIVTKDVLHLSGYTRKLPDFEDVRILLKAAILRADSIGYKFDGNKNRKPKKKSTLQEEGKNTTPNKNEAESSLLSGIFSEISFPTTGNSSRKKDEIDNSSIDSEQLEESDSDSSDEDSQCDVNDSAFFTNVSNEENDVEEYENEKEIDVLDENWKWNQWEKINDDETIPGPFEDDHYSGPHGLNPVYTLSFQTILQCIFNTTAMDRNFFKRLCSQSNKYARRVMQSRCTSMFLGHKWTNISTGEMVRFFGILLRISMEPRKMGGYASYFVSNPCVSVGGYSVQLKGYTPWAKDIMSLIRFKQIRSAFHPEAEKSICGDKCHQLRFFIRKFNEMARNVFSLGPHASFDEGGVAMRSRYCPVRQYNKDKPDKYRVDFFILADATHYFIYHLDVYQGRNTSNIDIHPYATCLPTTQKAVANAILKSGIDNDTNGCRYLMMDNRYTPPQLFALMLTNWNIRGVGTCRANRRGFASKELVLDKNAPRGSFVRLVDKRLGMVICRWKDSRILQTVSTIMLKGTEKIQRRKGSKIIEVIVPKDIKQYQNYMGGVDRGDQHRVMGAGFANVAHFKKWYKKAYLGLADFSMLQAFTAWNLSVDQVRTTGSRGGVYRERKKLLKWEFYAVAAEEMMNYVDEDEVEKGVVLLEPTPEAQHKPQIITRQSSAKNPTCIICSMSEAVERKVLNSSNKNRTGRKYARRKTYLATCTHPDCLIMAHVCAPDENKMKTLPQFRGMSCFDIAHHPECSSMFTVIQRGNKSHLRCLPTHNISYQLQEKYKELLPRRSSRGRPGRSEQAYRTPESTNTGGTPTSMRTPTEQNLTASNRTRAKTPSQNKPRQTRKSQGEAKYKRPRRRVITRRTRNTNYYEV